MSLGLWLETGSGSRAPRGPPHHAGAFVTIPSAVSLSQPLGRLGSVTAPLRCCIPQLASLHPLQAFPPPISNTVKLPWEKLINCV